MQRKVLGRGLDALIAGPRAVVESVPESGAQEISIVDIVANPYQPRSRFDDDAIRELSTSIKASGVLQPIIVRKSPDGGFQLVAGERRLRASGLAGLARIPAIIRDVPDGKMLEFALVENIQRENLNPIEEAKAYRALSEKAGLTHDEISERVGKQRVSITNSLRLLALPPEVQDMVSRETMSAGHARALLALEAPGDILAAARYVTSKGFSVRRTEAFVRRRMRRQHSRPAKARTNGLAEWENKLQQRFATRVTIAAGRKGGRVEFEYYSQEDLERLLEAWAVL